MASRKIRTGPPATGKTASGRFSHPRPAGVQVLPLVREKMIAQPGYPVRGRGPENMERLGDVPRVAWVRLLPLKRGTNADSGRRSEVRMLYGREKAWGEPNWQRRLGYWLLGELHIPGRLRSWHIIRALRALGLWDETHGLVVKHLGQALKPGGALLVTSPSVPQPRHLPLVAWRERRIGFDPSDYGHVRQGYSEERLRALFESAGLAVESVRRTFGPAGTLMFDLFFVTGDSRPPPLIYAALFPLYMALSIVDVMGPARGGAAIFGIARKRAAPAEWSRAAAPDATRAAASTIS